MSSSTWSSQSAVSTARASAHVRQRQLGRGPPRGPGSGGPGQRRATPPPTAPTRGPRRPVACSADHFGADAEVYFCLQRDRHQRGRAAVAAAAVRGDRLRRGRPHQRRRVRRPRALPRQQAADGGHPRRKAHPGVGGRRRCQASATSTTCRPGWSRSPRAPRSAPSTRSTRSRPWPSGPTPSDCWSTSTVPGSPTRQPSLGVDFGAFGQDAGVDVVSFGGTKNGALGAEAVVTFRTESRPRRCGSSASSRCSCRRRCASWPPSSWPC